MTEWDNPTTTAYTSQHDYVIHELKKKTLFPQESDRRCFTSFSSFSTKLLAAWKKLIHQNNQKRVSLYVTKCVLFVFWFSGLANSVNLFCYVGVSFCLCSPLVSYLSGTRYFAKFNKTKKTDHNIRTQPQYQKGTFLLKKSPRSQQVCNPFVRYLRHSSAFPVLHYPCR